MNDAPLTKHPDTGEPIRRFVLGGFGTLSSKSSEGSSLLAVASREAVAVDSQFQARPKA